MAKTLTESEKIVKKAAIMDAAIEIFAREGFHRATIRQIAEKAGMAVGTLYLYFENKDGVLREIFMRDIDEHLDRLFKKIEREPIEKALAMFYEDRFAGLSKNFRLTMLLVHEAMANPALGAMMYKKAHSRVNEYLEEYLEKKKASGEVRDVNSRRVSLMMTAIVMSFVMWKEALFAKQLEEPSYEEFAAAAVDVIANGLKR